MSLPVGVQTVTVNFGPILDFQGAPAAGETTFTPTAMVTHVPSGTPLIPRPISVVWDVAGSGSVVLPAVDSVGLDRSDWAYQVVHRTYTAGVPSPPGRTVRPLAAAPVIDLDLLVDSVTPSGLTVSQPAVVSVAGLTGAPTAQQVATALTPALGAAFVPFWKPSTAVLAGDVRMTALGLTIQRNSSGTTRASYDATEAALWTVTSGSGGGGGSTTDASLLTSGILPSARIADGSIADAKLASGTALTAAERTKLTGIATGATVYTDEQAQDAAAALIAAGTHTGISFAYDDTGNALSATVIATLTQTTQTGTTYTLVLGDANTLVESNSASAVTLTVPPNSSVAFPVGTTIGLRQYGAGQVTVAAGAGVTIRSRGAALKTAGQYAEASLTKRATDEWVLSGDLSV